MQLEYLDKCTIVDLNNTVIDPETGDTSSSILCQNQACDYQSSRTSNVNGTLVAESPKLFLPYDFEYSNLLSRNLTVIISRFRKVGSPYDWVRDEETGELNWTMQYSDHQAYDENKNRVENLKYRKYLTYTGQAEDIDFKVDFRGGNPDKKHLVSAKIEDWWEVRVGDPYLDGIQIELREVTYL